MKGRCLLAFLVLSCPAIDAQGSPHVFTHSLHTGAPCTTPDCFKLTVTRDGTPVVIDFTLEATHITRII